MLRRDEVLKHMAEVITKELVVCTIGIVGSEWNYYSGGRPCMFDSGAMGLASSLGLGVALGCPHRKVVILDGDGALLMNLGSLATIAQQQPANLVHLVFQNSLYESSGGQPTVNAERIDFASVARGAGIEKAYNIESIEDLRTRTREFLKGQGPYFAALRVGQGERVKVPMKRDYMVSKLRFMEFAQQG